MCLNLQPNRGGDRVMEGVCVCVGGYPPPLPARITDVAYLSLHMSQHATYDVRAVVLSLRSVLAAGKSSFSASFALMIGCGQGRDGVGLWGVKGVFRWAFEAWKSGWGEGARSLKVGRRIRSLVGH